MRLRQIIYSFMIVLAVLPKSVFAQDLTAEDWYQEFKPELKAAGGQMMKFVNHVAKGVYDHYVQYNPEVKHQSLIALERRRTQDPRIAEKLNELQSRIRGEWSSSDFDLEIDGEWSGQPGHSFFTPASTKLTQYLNGPVSFLEGYPYLEPYGKFLVKQEVLGHKVPREDFVIHFMASKYKIDPNDLYQAYLNKEVYLHRNVTTGDFVLLPGELTALLPHTSSEVPGVNLVGM